MFSVCLSVHRGGVTPWSCPGRPVQREVPSWFCLGPVRGRVDPPDKTRGTAPTGPGQNTTRQKGYKTRTGPGFDSLYCGDMPLAVR